MAHEIETYDNVLLHKERAWHGLGIVVEDELSPTEALDMAGLDYEIVQRPLFYRDNNGNDVAVPSHVANCRKDVSLLMGVVSSEYQPIQNRQMAEFCEDLLDKSGDVKIETIGTVRNGKRIWMLLKGKPFGVAKGDEIFPYICVSNGHDGATIYRVTPTTVRTVCSNTLHMVIPDTDTGELLQSAIAIKHTANALQRVEDAKLALKHYHERQESFRQTAERLARIDVKQEDVQRFFLECYTADFGEVSMNPQNKLEENRRNRAMSAFDSFSRRFDEERSIAGSSAWNAFNSYSGLIQHDKKARGKDDVTRVQKRVESNLFGLNQTRTQAAFGRALQMVG